MTGVAKELAERIVETIAEYPLDIGALFADDSDQRKAAEFFKDKFMPILTSALQPQWVSVGASRIALERQRQVESEGWTPEHDDEHSDGEMALAAACYASPQPIRADVEKYVSCGCREACCHHLGGEIPRKGWQDPWPWAEEWDKREKHGRIRQLEIAGALIAAEIDRLIRVLPAPPTEQNEREEEKTNG